MATVKFVALYLLSQTERRALRVPLNRSRIVIRGGNGFGKSAIIKSIYETLGASPQKIDGRWKSAGVSSALAFEYDGVRYTAVKAVGMFALFDSERRLLFFGNQITGDWSIRLADFFGFKLLMSNREGEIVTPWPSYIFAPFYVDQDTGWAKPWNNFSDLRLPESIATLADYHSGLKPEAYYAAKASIAADRLELTSLDITIATLRDAIDQIQQIEGDGGPTMDMDEFRSEMDDLVRESETLLVEQRRYRAELSDLHQEAHLYGAEKTLLERALGEIREEFDVAAQLGDEVECPTCGHHYANGVTDRFALIADEGVLTHSIGVIRGKLAKIAERERAQKAKLGRIDETLSRIERILAVENAAMTFGDVVVAAGKTEAAKILRSTLVERSADADEVRGRIVSNQKAMDELTSIPRGNEIRRFFRRRLSAYAVSLDVTLDSSQTPSIQGTRVARGSEGPRELLAYYYAFLHTRAEFNDATAYPIVIDAPNQQGQDDIHLPQMLEFIFSAAPDDTQVIVATEDVPATLPSDVEVYTYGERKRQVLRDSEFDEVSKAFFLYTSQMIAQ